MSTLMDILRSQPSAQDRFQQVQGLLSMMSQGAPPGASGGTSGGVPAGFGASGDNPWGIDPNGMNLVERHGTTLDQDAMQSLIAARRAGYNPFPYIGGGYRSPADSARLHDQRYDAQGNLIPGNLPAADAGDSMHNYGLAFDAGNLPQRVAAYLEQNGWYNGASWGDAPHYSYGRDG